MFKLLIILIFKEDQETHKEIEGGKEDLNYLRQGTHWDEEYPEKFHKGSDYIYIEGIQLGEEGVAEPGALWKVSHLIGTGEDDNL